MPLTAEQKKFMLSKLGGSDEKSEPLTSEQKKFMLQKLQGEVPQASQFTDPLQQTLGSMGALYSGLTGAKKGIQELGEGISKRGFGTLDEALMRGIPLGIKPSPQMMAQKPQEAPGLSELMAKLHPTAFSVGKFAGQALPLAFAPEMGAETLMGRLGASAATGAALGPVYDQDAPVGKAAAEGALLGLGGHGLSELAVKVPGAFMKMLKMGGAAPKGEIDKVVGAAKNLRVTVPAGELIQSPFLAKLQKVGLKNIPGSGMHQEYQKLSQGLQGQLQGLLSKLNPENEHSGAAVKDFLTEKYGALKNQVSEIYNDLGKNIDTLAPGKVHETSDLVKEAQRIKGDISSLESKPGGKIKSPAAVKDYVNQVKKEKWDIKDALTQDEILNEHIGEALAKISRGEREGRRELVHFKKLKSANLNDTERTIKDINVPEISKKWKEAKEFYKENIVPFESKGSVLPKIIDPKKGVDEIRNLFLKTSGQQPKSEILKEVSDLLPQDVKNKVAHDYLRGPGDRNILDSIDAYKKLQPKQRNLLFDTEDKKKLDDLLTIQNHVGKKEFNQMFVPPTGAQFSIAAGGSAIPAAMMAGFQFGGPLGALAAPAALIGGSRGLTKAVMSDSLNKMYLKALQGSTKAPRKVGKAGLGLLPLMGAGGSNNGQ